LLIFFANYNAIYNDIFALFFSFGYWKNKAVDYFETHTKNEILFDGKRIINSFNKSVDRNIHLSTLYFTKSIMKWSHLFKKRWKNKFLFKSKRFFAKQLPDVRSVFYFSDGRFFRRYLKNFGLVNRIRFLNFIKFLFLAKTNLIKFVLPKIYKNKIKLWKTDINISKWILRNLFVIFKRVYLISATREICGGGWRQLFFRINNYVMPDEYLQFKSLLKSAFVSSFSKDMVKVLGSLLKFGAYKFTKCFKLRNLLIGHAVKKYKKYKKI